MKKSILALTVGLALAVLLNLQFPTLHAQNVAGGTLSGTALTVTNTTNQIVLGTTNTDTLSFTAPAAGRTITFADPLGNDSVVYLAAAQTLTGKTFSGNIYSNIKVLAAPATYTSNATPAALTGFSWTVVPGTYLFEVNLPGSMTTSGGLTLAFHLTTAVITSIQYQTYQATATDNADAVSTQGTTTASDTKVVDNKTAAYVLTTVKGTMVVGTGGTFAWYASQNASHANTTTIVLGAYANMQRVL